MRQVVEIKQAVETTQQAISEWFTAIGTFGAAAIAVYVGVIREYLRRPALSVEYGGPDSGDAVVVLANLNTLPPDVAYVRVRVVCGTGRSTAEDVEATVIRVRELHPRPGVPPRDADAAIGGQLLVWSNTSPPTTRANVPAGVHRYLDLLRVIRSEAATNLGAAIARVEVYPTPSDNRHCIPSGSFDVDIAISARNADAAYYRIRVDYDGNWGDEIDGIWQHLNVGQPRRIKPQTP